MRAGASVRWKKTTPCCRACMALPPFIRASLPPRETGPHLNRPCAGVVLGALLPGCGRHAHYVALLVAACGANGGLSHLPARQHGVLEAMHTRGCQILCSTQQYAEDGMCCIKPLVVAVLSCKPIMVASAQGTRPSVRSSLGQDVAVCCSSAICKCICAVACSSFAWSCLHTHHSTFAGVLWLAQLHPVCWAHHRRVKNLRTQSCALEPAKRTQPPSRSSSASNYQTILSAIAWCTCHCWNQLVMARRR